MENEKDKIPRFKNIENINSINNTKETNDIKVSPRRTKVSKSFTNENVHYINVYKKSKLIISNDVEVNINSTLQVERVLELDRLYPNKIHGFEPPLFKEYLTKDTKINTHVKVGDTVILSLKYKKENNIPRKVKELYFTSLNNMTIIVAILDDNDYYASYQLELYTESNGS